WEDWLAKPLLARCAHHWSYLNTVGFAQVKPHAAVVRFEELIADPMALSHEVCTAVGLDPTIVGTHLRRWADRVQDTNSEAFVEALTSQSYSRPDHERRVGRWRENLSPQEVTSIWPILDEAAGRFGYSRDAG
ncbi:hypothetical protein, partial [Phenylobacterium sp.]|uniref:hypothetical protein n=1 Tax=Phenylobacterium sp. TaxID=1871053 RepID=UPI0025FD3435